MFLEQGGESPHRPSTLATGVVEHHPEAFQFVDIGLALSVDVQVEESMQAFSIGAATCHASEVLTLLELSIPLLVGSQELEQIAYLVLGPVEVVLSRHESLGVRRL